MMGTKRVVAAALACLLSAFAMPAWAQDRSPDTSSPPIVGGPMIFLYVIPGLRDDGGGDNAGTASTIHCSNTSTVSEQIRFVLRNFNGTVAADITVTVSSANTHTKSTHGTAITEDLPHLSPGVPISQGLMHIFATSQLVYCTAATVDAAAPNQGIPLHVIRFNPAPNSME